MAIGRSIKAILPSLGHSTVAASSAGTGAGNNPKEGLSAPVNATTTFTFNTASLAPTPTIRNGMLRIKATAAGTGPGQITKIVAQAKTATSTIIFFLQGSAFTAGDLFDLLVPFMLDIDATSFEVLVTVANIVNGGYTLDMELVGNP